MSDSRIDLLCKGIKSYRDFPKPGITFYDIFSLFCDVTLHKILKEEILSTIKDAQLNFDCVIGLDARGFLIGPLIADNFNVPFIPIRKAGKLPGECISHTYTLEYGADTIELQKDAMKDVTNVLLVDDLIATGGTMQASIHLIEQCHKKAAAIFGVIDLINIKKDFGSVPVISLLKL